MSQPNSKPSFDLIDGTAISKISNLSASGKIVLTDAAGHIIVVGQGGSSDISGKVVIARFYSASDLLGHSAGMLDESFNGSGIALSSLNNVSAQAATLTTDQSIVVSGRNVAATNSATELGFVVGYNADGSLQASVPVGKYLTTQPLVVSSTNTATDMLLLRYSTNNVLDVSFNNSGGVIKDISTYDSPRTFVTQANGKIIVAGSTATTDGIDGDFVLVRYNDNGTLDTDFGASGVVKTDFSANDDEITSLAVQSDGKIIAVGRSGGASGYKIAAVRYNQDGTIDTSFANNGKFIYSFSNTSDFGESVTIADDKIIIVGETLVKATGNYDYALVRLKLEDGSLDSSFGNQGAVTTEVTANNDFAYGVTVDALGKIIVTGSSNIIDKARATSDLTLVRYNSDGSLDDTFVKTNTLNATPDYFNNNSAIMLDNDVLIRDAELDAVNNYAGASISLNSQNSSDVLTRSGHLVFQNGYVVDEGVLVGNYIQSANALKINFNNASTTNLVNDVLQHLAFASNAGVSTDRVTWTFDDGQGTGTNQTATGNIDVNIIAGADPATNIQTTVIGIAQSPNTVSGYTSNDTITGAKGVDTLNGNAGDDTLYGLAGNDKLYGGAGDDYLDGGAGKNALFGGIGDDIYLVYSKNDKVTEAAGEGTDLVVSALNYILPKNVENLTLNGAAKLSGTGNDLSNTLYGNQSANSLSGKNGDDNLFGLDGNDKLSGGAGSDRLEGGLGNDKLSGDAGNDNMLGGAGNDNLAGGAGNDNLEGDEGDDILSGGAGDDQLVGNDGNDKLTGDAGADKLFAGAGDDKLSGGAGNDILVGDVGNDKLAGDDGSDLIFGGAGKDTQSGGKGQDAFYYSAISETGLTKATWDVIKDFTHSQHDKIDLSAIDADTTTSTDDKFELLTFAAKTSAAQMVFTKPGQLIFDAKAHVLYGNVDADLKADFAIELTGVKALVADDFIL